MFRLIPPNYNKKSGKKLKNRKREGKSSETSGGPFTAALFRASVAAGIHHRAPFVRDGASTPPGAQKARNEEAARSIKRQIPPLRGETKRRAAVHLRPASDAPDQVSGRCRPGQMARAVELSSSRFRRVLQLQRHKVTPACYSWTWQIDRPLQTAFHMEHTKINSGELIARR